MGARSYQTVKAILKAGLDQQKPEQEEATAIPEHENVRGPEYFH